MALQRKLPTARSPFDRLAIDDLKSRIRPLKLRRRISAAVRSPRFLPILLIIAGAALLLFVASQYGSMYLAQKRLATRWEQEQQKHTQSPEAAADDSMIRLVIPRIELTSFVMEGTNHRSLLLGPGHMAHTPQPGDSGNSVISGHRDTFFRHIHELEKGDQIYVERGGKRVVYEVTGKKIVDPDDVSVTRPSKETELTLITCYPTYYIGPAPKRLVVFAKSAPADQEATLTTSGQKKLAHAAQN